MYNVYLPDKEYKGTKIIYVITSAIEMVIVTLTSGIYLAKITTSIGMSDALTAVLSTVTTLASLMQILAMVLANRPPYKRWVIPILSVANLFLTGFYVVTFIKLGKTALGIILFSLILIANMAKNVIGPLKLTWFMNVARDSERGSLQAVNSLVTSAVLIVFLASLGKILDYFESIGKLDTAFVIFGVAVFICSSVMILLLIFAKEKPITNTNKKHPFANIGELLKIKPFRTYLILMSLWNAALAISKPFYNTYIIKELGISVGTASLLQVMERGLALFTLFYASRLARKVKSIKFYRFYYISEVIAMLFMVFATPGNGLLMMIIYYVIFSVTHALNAVSSAVVYDIANPSKFANAAVITFIASGFLSFCTTLAVTPLFNYIHDTLENKMFGITVYAQQFLVAITVIIGIVLAIFVNTVFAKQMREYKTTVDK